MKTNKINAEDLSDKSYPGFSYNADQLSKFLAASNLFTILLKNREIIHFTANDAYSFHQWLTQHNVENIKFDKKDEGVK